jgi:hypothetical protein
MRDIERFFSFKDKDDKRRKYAESKDGGEEYSVVDASDLAGEWTVSYLLL